LLQLYFQLDDCNRVCFLVAKKIGACRQFITAESMAQPRGGDTAEKHCTAFSIKLTVFLYISKYVHMAVWVTADRKNL